MNSISIQSRVGKLEARKAYLDKFDGREVFFLQVEERGYDGGNRIVLVGESADEVADWLAAMAAQVREVSES